MDSYTAEEKAMVEERFSDSREGTYRAHQPIYGCTVPYYHLQG
jgi:hypothetical protein